MARHESSVFMYDCEQDEQGRPLYGALYVYRCMDGNEFRAWASSEAKAFQRLNAERPGVLATLVRVVDAYGRTLAPADWLRRTGQLSAR